MVEAEFEDSFVESFFSHQHVNRSWAHNLHPRNNGPKYGPAVPLKKPLVKTTKTRIHVEIFSLGMDVFSRSRDFSSKVWWLQPLEKRLRLWPLGSSLTRSTTAARRRSTGGWVSETLECFNLKNLRAVQRETQGNWWVQRGSQVPNDVQQLCMRCSVH